MRYPVVQKQFFERIFWNLELHNTSDINHWVPSSVETEDFKPLNLFLVKNEQRETTWWLWWHLVKKIQFQTSEQHLFSCHSPLISSLFYLARKNMLLLLAENECLHGGLGGIPKGLTNPGKSIIVQLWISLRFITKKSIFWS